MHQQSDSIFHFHFCHSLTCQQLSSLTALVTGTGRCSLCDVLFYFTAQKTLSISLSHCPFVFSIVYVLLSSFQDSFYFENDIYNEECEEIEEVSLSDLPSLPVQCRLVYVSASCYEYSSLYRLYSFLDHLISSKNTCTSVNLPP